ncbi:MAG: phosphoglucomutase, partial [Amphiamblys sp. WSBS2006]
SFLFSEIARVNGIAYYETDAASKEMGYNMKKLEESHINVLLGFKEGSCFFVGNHVWEMDGIATTCLFHIILGELSRRQKTLEEYLGEALEKYPEIKTSVFYYVAEDRGDVENAVEGVVERIGRDERFVLGERKIIPRIVDESVVAFHGERRKVTIKKSFAGPRITVYVEFVGGDPTEEAVSFCEDALAAKKNNLTRKMLSE